MTDTTKLLFSAAAAGDIAAMERLVAHHSVQESALAIEAQLSDDVLRARLLSATSNQLAMLPSSPWGPWLYGSIPNVAAEAVDADAFDSLRWLFESEAMATFPRTRLLFIPAAAKSAIEFGRLDLLEYLLTLPFFCGSSISEESRDDTLSELLDAATKAKDLDAISIVLAHGANINTKGSTCWYFPLEQAAEEDGGELAVQKLIAEGAFFLGPQAVLRATWRCRHESLCTLISSGWDPAATDDDGNTALHAAASEGWAQGVTTLLAMSAMDLDRANYYIHVTPLGVALQLEIARMTEAQRWLRWQPQDSNRSAAQEDSTTGEDEDECLAVARVLVKSGADVLLTLSGFRGPGAWISLARASKLSTRAHKAVLKLYYGGENYYELEKSAAAALREYLCGDDESEERVLKRRQC